MFAKNNLMHLLLFSYLTMQSTQITQPYNPKKHSIKESKEEHPILDLLLCNPSKALEKIRKVLEELIREEMRAQIKEGIELPLLPKRVDHLKQKYEQQCPLFLLEECEGTCIFSRKTNPSLRETYEAEVNSLLLKKIQQYPNRPIHSAHFGCGGALSDVIIITKTLAQKPDAQLHIHLIDIQHAPYIEAQEFLNNTHEIQENVSIDFDHLSSAYIPGIIKHSPGSIRSDDQLKDEAVSTIWRIETKYHQCLKWLRSTFPKAKISLSIHSTYDNYLDYIKNKNIPYADVVTAIDIPDETNFMQGGAKDYACLCKKTLQENPTASNVWLADYKGTIGFITCSLTQPANCLNTLEDDDNVPAYITMTEKVAHLHKNEDLCYQAAQL